MDVLCYIILGIYILALSAIGVYCLFQFHLLISYLSQRQQDEEIPLDLSGDDLPVVTIQLPIFNEYYVVERLIDNIIKTDYPKNKLEIQVLDDSTDDTLNLSREKVEEYKSHGYDISLYARTDRTGYKAGALKDATPYAKGEIIAIFDADFLPDPDFLRKTVPYFTDKKVGVVQTRWGHLNQDYSLLTELQAFQLNVHFTVEQKGRYSGNYLLQFNGTAGLWRKETILDAGGWEADTLTEDLDLSYRAQLEGWKIIFLEDTLSPAELPAEMIGLKSQQHRWMKGGAETARKLLPKVWRSDLSLAKKMHATSHLLASSVFLAVFLVGIFSVPLMLLINPMGISLTYVSVFVVSTILIAMVYYVANVEKAWKQNSSRLKRSIKFIFLFPIFLALSMGLSLHNSLAVLQGYLGRKTSFVRTPKFDILKMNDSFRKQKYQGKKLPFATMMEGILALYFFSAIVFAISTGNNTFIAFHFMLCFGYAAIFYYSVSHIRN